VRKGYVSQGAGRGDGNICGNIGIFEFLTLKLFWFWLLRIKCGEISRYRDIFVSDWRDMFIHTHVTIGVDFWREWVWEMVCNVV
jgi:hypothetical protein